jgi:hypothetical protein
MGIYETPLGYQVKETIDGLDVTENGEFVCELSGKSLDDFRYSVDDEYSEVDDDKLEDAIKETIEDAEMLSKALGYC